MNAPHLETDWREVAMFLASFITEGNPAYTLLIFQAIADCTKTTIPAQAGERISAS